MEILDKPEKIYLQLGEDAVLPDETITWDEFFNGSITWSEDKQFNNDLEYYSPELVINFLEWCYEEPQFTDFAKGKKSEKELFEIFLKDKNFE